MPNFARLFSTYLTIPPICNQRYLNFVALLRAIICTKESCLLSVTPHKIAHTKPPILFSLVVARISVLWRVVPTLGG